MLKTGWLIAIIAVAVLAAVGIIFGNLNQDEGWYLYAAGLVSKGQMPYRDFAFTQGPVMPYVYALCQPLIRSGGLAAGRLLTCALGVAGALLAAWLAGRLVSPGNKQIARLFCFTLLLVNVYQVYFCTVVKTYSLTVFLLAGALLLLHQALVKRNGLLTILAAALLVMAAGARSSAAVILPVIFCLLWLDRRRLGFPGWIYFAFGGFIAAVMVFGAFLVQCPDNFIYFVMRYHTLRHEGSPLAALMFKAGLVSRVLQAYFVCFTFWIAAVIFKLSGRIETFNAQRSKLDVGRWTFNVFKFLGIKSVLPQLCSHKSSETQTSSASTLIRRSLWLGAIAVSLVHFFAPFPYDDYQVFIFPFFAIAVSAMLMDAVPSTCSGQAAHGGRWALLAVLCLSLASAVASPVNQEWFIEGRELIWWRAKDSPALVKLRRAAARVRSLCKPGDMLLTQDPYLAVESGCTLPHGLEMGQFSYFPGLTREQAAKLNVLNREMFAELLQNCPAPVAAFSGYGFAMQAPQITPVLPEDKALFLETLNTRYEFLETIPHFGQASTELRLFRKK